MAMAVCPNSKITDIIYMIIATAHVRISLLMTDLQRGWQVTSVPYTPFTPEVILGHTHETSPQFHPKVGPK